MSYHRGKGFGFSGFSLKKQDHQPPPPPSAALSKHGYHTLTAISQNAIAGSFSYGQPRKRPKTEDEYVCYIYITDSIQFYIYRLNILIYYT